jgi:hypothetical protein
MQKLRVRYYYTSYCKVLPTSEKKPVYTYRIYAQL